MKKLLLIFTLLFSTLMFSTPSYGEWTKVSSTGNGADTFHVDFERIRKHDGYVYFWQLSDFLKPLIGQNNEVYLSSKNYKQVDCKLFRQKVLSASFHNEPMGKGSGYNAEIKGKHANWKYPSPNSALEEVLQRVCSQ